MKRLFIPVVALGLLASLALVPAWALAAQPGGMGGWWADSGEPVSLEQAHARASEYLTQVDLSNLEVSEVMEFSNHFYAAVLNPTSGEGAFELLISLDGRRVHPEPGPTMMWNTEYSPMSGTNGAALLPGMGSDMMDSGMMMGSGMMSHDHRAATDCLSGMGYVADTGEPLAQPLSAEAAVDLAQAWLDNERPGLTVADPIAFPGYVTVHVERGAEIVGMLSIQTTTGAIWEHVWHGDFVVQFAADH